MGDVIVLRQYVVCVGDVIVLLRCVLLCGLCDCVAAICGLCG